MITKKEKKSRDELFRLIQENPDLPVVPITEEGGGLGSWGSSCIDEYLICERYNYVALKSWDDTFDVLEKYLSDAEFEKLPESEDECRKVYNALPWTKAIIVYINAAS